MIKKIKPIASLLLLMSTQAMASPQCWEIHNLRGTVAFADENYKFRPDGFKNKVIRVVFNGKQSTITDWEVNCLEVPGNAVMCIQAKASSTAIEVWRIDQLRQKATMSRIRTGFDIYDSAGTFVGDVKTCDS